MTNSASTEIEEQFAQLPPQAQLSLLERLVHRVRLNLGGEEASWEQGLAQMASDPQVRLELKTSSREFSRTELDGLA